MHKSVLKHNYHFNIILQRIYNKDGNKIFKYAIIEICKPEERIKREQYYINERSEYNLCRIAEMPSSAPRTRKTRKKISERMKGNKHLLGHKHTKQTRKKISQSLKGRKCSELTKQKARERMIKRNKENPPMKGKKFTRKRRLAISVRMKKLSKTRRLPS